MELPVLKHHPKPPGPYVEVPRELPLLVLELGEHKVTPALSSPYDSEGKNAVPAEGHQTVM